jgi:hypothetical protein
VLEHENYAIALPKNGGPLNHLLNAPLLEETESAWWDRTLFQYLGKRSCLCIRPHEGAGALQVADFASTAPI